MLLILISWCYIFLSLLNFGFLACSIFRIRSAHALYQLTLGLSILMMLAHLWAFIEGFGLAFHSLLLSVNVILFIVYKHNIIGFFWSIWRRVFSWSLYSKLLLGTIFFIVLAKSSAQGAMLDNENYYIQTIKWLNEYGFVTGLGNFHLFFGQTSGWHVIQSVFSFHFLNIAFNDIGGLLLLIINVFAINKLESNTRSIFIGLPLFNWLLLEFTIVPSPDFGVIFFSLVSVGYFIYHYQKPSISSIYVLLFFVLSAVHIKITAICLLVLPFVLMYKKSGFFKRNWLKLSLLSIIISAIWISKNMIITGMPFFPSSVFSNVIQYDYQIPQELYEYSLRSEKLLEFFVSVDEFETLSFLDLFWKWLTSSSIGMVFNLLTFGFLMLLPFLLLKTKQYPSYKWIYLSFCAQVLFLMFTSPQYRFMLHYIVILSLIVFSIWIKSETIKRFSLFLTQIAALWFLFFPVNQNKISSKAYKMDSVGFNFSNFIYPAPNTSLNTNYVYNKYGNLEYFSPEQDVYFWSNGIGELPCINDFQLMYISEKIGYRPQLIDSTDLSKGFYSETLSK